MCFSVSCEYSDIRRTEKQLNERKQKISAVSYSVWIPPLTTITPHTAKLQHRERRKKSSIFMWWSGFVITSVKRDLSCCFNTTYKDYVWSIHYYIGTIKSHMKTRYCKWVSFTFFSMIVQSFGVSPIVNSFQLTEGK